MSDCRGSESTVGTDRGEKFLAYKLLESLKEYVLVQQKSWEVDGGVSCVPRQFRELRNVGLYGTSSGNVTGGEDPERVGLAFVTPSVFTALGVDPILGRGFTAEEAKPDISEVVVLSYRLWNRRYGADTDLVGGRIELNAVPRTVIGILPPGFRLPIDFTRETPLDVYLPLDAPEGIGDTPR